MSAPQPPNQPWGGGQPPHGPPSGPQPQQDNPFGSPEPTQVVQPGQPQQQPGGLFGDTPEPTQVVQPVQPGQPAEGGAEATQLVNPAGGGDAPVADSTQLVPPGSQPPPAIPYTPPPSAADNPAAAFGQQQGFGQPGPGGYGQPQYPGQQPGQPPQGFGGPGGPGFGGPGQPGFGAPAPAFGGGSSSGGLFGYIAGGVVAVLGLIGLIIAFGYMGDASDYSKAFDSAPDQQAIDTFLDNLGVVGPGTLWFYVIMILVGALVSIAGGVGLAFASKLGGIKKLVPIVVAAGGALLAVFALLVKIGMTPKADALAKLSASAKDTFGLGLPPLIIGVLILIVGVLGLIPGTAQFVGLGDGGSAPAPQQGGFGGPPPGYGQPPQQQGFGQPGPPPGYGHGQPPQGPPPGFGGPPPGYGQPGGPNPNSGGFPQPGHPQGPPSGGFGQPQYPGQPGQPPPGYGQQPGYGPPPGQQGPPPGYGQQQQPPQW